MEEEVAERRSLKLRVKLLRAKLVRALEEEVKVRSVVELVKLKSRSEELSGGKKKEESSMTSMMDE